MGHKLKNCPCIYHADILAKNNFLKSFQSNMLANDSSMRSLRGWIIHMQGQSCVQD